MAERLTRVPRVCVVWSSTLGLDPPILHSVVSGSPPLQNLRK